MTRDQRQIEAEEAWERAGRRGTVAGATGFGKTKVALNAISKYPKDASILIGVPTIKLRDIDWPTDAAVWKVDIDHCQRICHASMPKVTGQTYDLVVLDEGHHLTYLREPFFQNNTVKAVLVLTATYPKQDDYKYDLLSSIAPVCYEYPLDQAVKDGSVADYKIYVVTCPLDDTVKHVQGGSKKKPFMTTEAKHYEYLTRTIQKFIIKGKSGAGNFRPVVDMYVRKRAQFVYNLKYTKTEPARKILEALQDERVLAFCGSIAQAEDLLPGQAHHSKVKKPKAGEEGVYERFLKLEFNHMAAVKAVDEGSNIPLLDVALIVQATSEHRRLIQRIGRVLRQREGHTGTVFILAAVLMKTDDKGNYGMAQTCDTGWVSDALADAELDKDKIFYVTLNDLLHGFDTQRKASTGEPQGQ